MRNLVMGMATLLAVGLAGSAYADVCTTRACDAGTGPGSGSQEVCCPDPDPENIAEPSAEVVTCGAITVDATTYIAGCIGSDAGENNIAGCTSVGGAVTTNDLLMEDSDCAADAVAACEDCGCAQAGPCVAN